MAEYIFEKIAQNSDGVDSYINHGELVRCKDCKHRDKYDCNKLTFGDIKCGVPDDWFCADGERKETENADNSQI